MCNYGCGSKSWVEAWGGNWGDEEGGPNADSKPDTATPKEQTPDVKPTAAVSEKMASTQTAVATTLA